MSVDANRWRQARDLFHACLEVPAEQRAATLEQACRGDRSLLLEVRSLLEYHDDPQTLVDLGGADPLLPEAAVELERYELLEVLGQGGMGVVYRARRADGVYDEEVAIKLVHRDLAAADLVQRFWQERQILADLRHPAIARLVDGGTASDGRPFLVMEYVDGVPIDRYCDQHRLTVRERVCLFAKVCRAVHFAHQSLIVHRDLKPGNLLVDVEGEPRLLDFGVAKLIDPSVPDLTRDGATGAGSPLTPDFASPEQVTGGVITAASDTYALGALLYLLLTGARPMRSKDLALSEFVEAVCHRDPTAPSQRVALEDGDARSPGDSQDIAEARGCGEVSRLIRELSGDLDRVVAMAMHKDPRQRYSSAEALAQDLDRYVDGRPVLARDQTAVYRVGKFLRRHRWPCLFAGTAVLALLCLAIGLLLQRDRLLEEQALSREVTGFLEGLFEVSTPEAAGGRPILARELLDQGAFDVGNRFAAQPRLRTRLVSAMGRAYLSLGHLQEAAELLEQSFADRRSLYPPSHPELVDGLLDLGELRNAQGDFDAAAEIFEEAGKRRKARAGADERSLRGLLGAAHARQLQGEYQAALAIQRSALEQARELLGDRHPRYALALRGLGELLRMQGDFAAAREALEQARGIYQEVYEELHPEVARLDLQLGLLLEEEGRYPESEQALRDAVRIQSALYPENHPERAEPLNNLASVVLRQGRAGEAEKLCLEGLALRRQALEPDHPAIGDSLNLLGLILRQQGRDDEAEQAFREARDLWRHRLGPDYVLIAAASNNLASILAERGDMQAAERELQEALRIYRAAFGENHLQVATVLNNLAVRRKEQGDLAAARRLYGQALGIMEQVLGPEHPRTAGLAHNLGVLLGQLGEPEAAEPLLRTSLAGLTKALPAQHPHLGLVRKNLGAALHALERQDEAEELLLAALEIYRAAGESGQALAMLEARGFLAEVYIAQSRHDEAGALLEADLAAGLEEHGPESEIVDKTRRRLRQLASAR